MGVPSLQHTSLHKRGLCIREPPLDTTSIYFIMDTTAEIHKLSLGLGLLRNGAILRFLGLQGIPPEERQQRLQIGVLPQGETARSSFSFTT